MRPLHYLNLLLAAILLVGCQASQTTHSFYWHGNDSINTAKSFTYVEYGIVGRSSAVYYPNKLHKKNNGEVREGLIADAKANLRQQYDLQANQAFANFSIDVLNTKTGMASSTGLTNVDKVVIEVVISADVIEYVND